MRLRLLSPYLAALLLATQLASAQAPAAENPEARRTAYQKGSDAINAKNWPEAERIFKQLWIEHPTYDVALGLGQAEFLQQKYRDAAEHLAFGIRNFPPREKPEALTVPKQALDQAKKHVGALQVTVDRPGADVFVDGARVGTSPLEDSAFAEPGSHVVEARIADHSPTQRTVQAKAGEDQNVDLKFIGAVSFSGMAEHPPATSQVGSDRDNTPPQVGAARSRSLVPIYIGAGIGVIGAVGFTVFELGASSENDSRARLRAKNGVSGCADMTASPADCGAERDAANSHDRNRNLATVSAIVGAAGLISIPIYLLLQDSGGAEAARHNRTRLRAGVSFGRISLAGEF